MSVLGAILPPMIILSLVSIFYDAFRTNPYIGALLNGMKAGVGAVIISVVYDMGRSIVATLGCILPSCVFVTLLAYIYSRYKKFSLLQGTLSALRPAVVDMIAKAGITILVSAFFVDDIIIFSRSAIELRMILYFVIAMILLRKVKLSPIVVMLSCGGFELVYYIFNYVVLHT